MQSYIEITDKSSLVYLGKGRREQPQNSGSEFEDCMDDEDCSDDEDGSGSGSGEESNASSAGEDYNSHSKKKKKLKSGRYRKMGSKIKKDVIWAHELLKVFEWRLS